MGKWNRLMAGMSLVGMLAGGGSAQAGVLIDEGFDAIPAGWEDTNNSIPPGSTEWFFGNPGIFPAQAGASDSYAAANYLNADFGGNISNWLFTPVVALSNGSVLSFYTRTETAAPFPDRLEVRLSTNGASIDVGSTDTSVGDFATLLLAINPGLAFGGFPEDWTQFTTTLSGVGSNVQGRLAFRYFVTDTSTNGDYIGIDTVRLETARVPEPSTLLVMALGLAMLGWRLHRPSAE